MIFKLQRPLLSTEPQSERLVLAYNRDRSWQGQFYMEDDEISIIFQGEMKVYVEGEVNDDGQIIIVDHAEDQDW